jgi:hypothetical protein
MRRRTYLLWKKLLTRLLVLLAVLGVLYALFISHAFTIASYEFEGIPYEYKTPLSETFDALAREKISWILPGNRTFSFHKKAMKREIMDALPNSKAVSIRPAGLHSIKITVDPYVAAFAMDNGFALSKEGVIYKEIGTTFDLPNISLSTSTALTAGDIAAITMFVDQIDAVLFDVGKITVDEHNDIRFYAKDDEAYVTVNGTANLGRSWSNILSAIDTDPLKGKLAKGAGSLEYLDARFGNKVFYKFTTSENSAIIPETYASSTATTTLH